MMAVAVLAAASGCSPATVGGARVIDIDSGRVLRPAETLRRLTSVRHVYVGEEHASALHQRVQLEVVRALHDAGARVAIAAEWLPAEAQPEIDAYIAKHTDEAAFLERVHWKHRWGFPFAAYAPIFRWARAAGVPVWALNAPPGLARKVARGVPLTDAERRVMPPLDTGNPEHEAFFRRRMEGASRGHPAMRPGALDRYYRAQLLWDESMSRNLVRHLRATDRIAVVCAGLGHVDFGYGSPRRAERLLGQPGLIVLARPSAEPPPAAGQAHLLWIPPAGAGTSRANAGAASPRSH